MKVDIKKCLEMYINGQSMREIADHFKCDKTTVLYHLHRNNISIRNPQSPNYGTVEDRKEEIINLFNQGLSCSEISKTTTINCSSICSLLKKNGYNTSRYSTHREDKLINNLDTIKKMYEGGMRSGEIAEIFKTRAGSISRLMRENGVKAHTVYKYTVNNDFFVGKNHLNMYVLGLIYADGNVDKSKRSMSLGLQEEDGYIVEKISKIMEYTGPLYYINNSHLKNRKNMTVLCITKKKLVLDLVELGVVPRKSLILDFPTKEQVPHEFLSSYLLGCMDGDGFIGLKIKGYYISLTSSSKFIAGLLPVVENLGILNYRIEDTDNNLTKKLCISQKDETQKFLEFIYKDAPLYLTRKFDRAVEMFPHLSSYPLSA